MFERFILSTNDMERFLRYHFQTQTTLQLEDWFLTEVTRSKHGKG